MTLAPPLTITIPPALASALGDEAAPRWVLEALVLAGVNERLLSIGEAGEVLGLGYFETEALVKERGGPLVLTDEEAARDRADLGVMFPELFSPSRSEG